MRQREAIQLEVFAVIQGTHEQNLDQDDIEGKNKTDQLSITQELEDLGLCVEDEPREETLRPHKFQIWAIK